jgi:hypothetical protein
MPVQRRKAEDPGDLDAYSIKEFCRRNQLSQGFYFKLQREGLGPQTMLVGTKVLISQEAAARWRKEREAAAKRAAQGRV